jgi:hypothetical protein
MTLLILIDFHWETRYRGIIDDECLGNSRVTDFMFVAESVSDARSAFSLSHRLCHKN